jgi:transcriptional regulator GlxA family with amidase domain
VVNEGLTHTISAQLGLVAPGQMVDDEVLDWLRKVHRTTTWTASVCMGALILGAAGILKGSPATTLVQNGRTSA